ncbi:MAG: hypothetical protein COB30_001765 [Ectothiorhodospiraceae bacterium]|nr:hypothetical protein [Ectothiorhodospiraceae bacterium]
MEAAPQAKLGGMAWLEGSAASAARTATPARLAAPLFACDRSHGTARLPPKLMTE